MQSETNRRLRLFFLVAIVAGTFAAYWPVQDHDFINYDDPLFVSENETVTQGLTIEGLEWAWTTSRGGNWMPLTWLSHMLDCELFGTDPGPHHVVNVLIHTATSVLLFLVLVGMTGDDRPSAFVALLFALHPLHVESVAWIAERKDVLSGLFWVAVMGAHARFVRRPGTGRYLLVVVLFACGLLAKPMLVTLPFALLLLDCWPLGRVSSLTPRALWPLVREKLPLFALAAASSTITLFSQQYEGAVITVQRIPIAGRLASVAMAYVHYLADLIWPRDLAVFYPYEESIAPAGIAASIVVLSAVTLAALRCVRRSPAFAVGWLWFLGTLVPVIGLVQIGTQARADRYTYLPSIGLFAAIAWGVPALLPTGRRRSAALAALGTLVVLACGVLAARQVQLWQDSESLYRHTLAVTNENDKMAYNLGVHLADAGRDSEAVELYRETLRIRPGRGDAWFNMGNSLARLGRRAEALEAYRSALRVAPHDAGARRRIATLLQEEGQAALRAGRFDEAARIFEDLLAGQPDDLVGLTSLAWILVYHPIPERHDPARGLTLVERADGLGAGDDPMVLLVRATCLARLGRRDAALGEARRAQESAVAEGQAPIAEMARRLLAELLAE